MQVNSLSGEAIFFGGEHFDGKFTRFYNDLFRCEVKKNELHWKRIQSQNMPTPRSSQQAVVTPAQQMFLFGGEFGTSKETKFFHYKDFWMLDLKTFAWEDLTMTVKPLPPPRSGHRMAIWKHIIAMFGGFYDASAGDTKYFDDLWLFDTREYKWTKVDWLNDANNRPSPRSGFQFVSVESGIILYGGYCQVKGKGGEYEGQVLNDMWLLKLDPVDVKKSRWERKKISSSAVAPSPRSGPASCAGRGGRSFYLFGGVQDETVGDELLSGTCLNDFWEYSIERNQWRQLNISEGLVPRYNANMFLIQSTLILSGGIYECEDRQYVLDDAHCISNVEKMDKFTCVRKLSVDLESWQGSASEGEGEEDAGSDSDLSDSDSYEDDSDCSGDDEEDSSSELPQQQESNHPQIFPGQTLKDYFAENQEFWLQQAQAAYPTTTNSKQLRGEAFQMAQQAYNEHQMMQMMLK